MDKHSQSLLFYWSLIILDILTFLLNGVTCIMFVRFRRRLLASTHNMILFSMALADTLVGIFGTSLGALLLLKQSSLYYKIFGNIPMFSSLFISVLSLALLTLDRLIALKRPFQYSSPKYRRLITRLLIFFWVVPIIISVQQVLVFVYLSSKNELIVRSILFSGFFLLAALVLVCSNGFLIISINKHFSIVHSRLSKHSGAMSVVDEESPTDYALKVVKKSVVLEQHLQQSQQRCKRTALSGSDGQIGSSFKGVRRLELKQTSIFCIAIVTLFLLFWLPLAAYRTCYAAGISLKISWLRRFALCLTVLNSLLNPVLYFLVKRDLRKYLKRTFICGR